MTLDGLEQLLKVAFRRRRDGVRQYRLKVNLIRYADDFIITGPNYPTGVKAKLAKTNTDRALQVTLEVTLIGNT